MPNQARAPLRIAVCDDEALDRAQIAQMAQEILRAEEIPAEIACFASARALMHAIQTGGAFQILLLDVMIEGMDGMELAAALRAGQEEAAAALIPIRFTHFSLRICVRVYSLPPRAARVNRFYRPLAQKCLIFSRQRRIIYW